MQVRLYDVAHGSRVNVHPLQMVDDEIVLAHYRFIRLYDVRPVPAGVLGDLERVAAVVEYVTPGMRYQKERNRNLVWITQPLIHLDELHLRLDDVSFSQGPRSCPTNPVISRLPSGYDNASSRSIL